MEKKRAKKFDVPSTFAHFKYVKSVQIDVKTRNTTAGYKIQSTMLKVRPGLRETL